jgi:restriction system protein
MTVLPTYDAITCLKELKAAVSKHPGELVPVKPILDFNMIDPRFVVEADVLSTLDQRPNLMELSPSEFESLITNLFAKMGVGPITANRNRRRRGLELGHDPARHRL